MIAEDLLSLSLPTVLAVCLCLLTLGAHAGIAWMRERRRRRNHRLTEATRFAWDLMRETSGGAQALHHSLSLSHGQEGSSESSCPTFSAFLVIGGETTTTA